MSDPANAVPTTEAAAVAALRQLGDAAQKINIAWAALRQAINAVLLRQAVDAAQEAELARAFGACTASIDIRRAVLAINPDMRVTRFGDCWFAHIGGNFLFDGHDGQSRIEGDSPEICWLRLGRWLLKHGASL